MLVKRYYLEGFFLSIEEVANYGGFKIDKYGARIMTVLHPFWREVDGWFNRRGTSVSLFSSLSLVSLFTRIFSAVKKQYFTKTGKNEVQLDFCFHGRRKWYNFT